MKICGADVYSSPQLRILHLECEEGFAASGIIDDASSEDYGTF